MKQKYIDLYMNWARSCAQLSHARRLQVGAIVVKEDRVISMGYNGMPAGWDNNCEYEVIVEEGEDYSIELKTRPEVLHAESNAISKLARSGESGLDSTLFVTHSPCIDCAKLIYQAGIRTVYFGSAYRSSDGVDFLKTSGIEVNQIEK